MSYHTMPYSARANTLGDESEAKYLELHPNSDRYGFDHTDINLKNVPAFVRYRPDFIQHNRLVECMGFGRDGTLKIKLEKLYVLQQWNSVFHTDMFFWDSSERRHITMHVNDVALACKKNAKLDQFHEGNPAWFLKVDTILPAWDWVTE